MALNPLFLLAEAAALQDQHCEQLSSPESECTTLVAVESSPCSPITSKKRRTRSWSIYSSESQPPRRATRSNRDTLRPSRPQLRAKQDMRLRREEVKAKASGIATVSNSPVNENQLLLLREIYSHVTPYPPEHLISIIAITIKRSYSQIKNWFSNTRQSDVKRRGGGGEEKEEEVVPLLTETGDRLRLRPSAVENDCEWTDDFFKDLVQILYFKILLEHIGDPQPDSDDS